MAPVTLSYERLVELIGGCEQALAVIRREERRARNDRRRGRFRATASTIDAVLTHLRDQWRARHLRSSKYDRDVSIHLTDAGHEAVNREPGERT